MNCVSCNTGELKPGKTIITVEKNGVTVVLKDVPAQVCEVCGAWYVDIETSQIIADKVNDAIAKGAELEVIRLAAA